MWFIHRTWLLRLLTQIRLDLNCWCLRKINGGHRSGTRTSTAKVLLGVSLPTDRKYRFSPWAVKPIYVPIHHSPGPHTHSLWGWRNRPIILFAMAISAYPSISLLTVDKTYSNFKYKTKHCFWHELRSALFKHKALKRKTLSFLS